MGRETCTNRTKSFVYPWQKILRQATSALRGAWTLISDHRCAKACLRSIAGPESRASILNDPKLMIHVSIALVFPKLLSGDICLRVSGEIRAGAANRTFHLSSIEQCGRTCNDDNEQNPDENPSPLHGQPSFRTPWYTSSRDSDVICNGSPSIPDSP